MSTAPVNAGPNTTVKPNNTVNSSGPTAANATQATTTAAAGNLTARTNDAPMQSSGPNLAANKLPTLPPPKAFEMSDASMSAFIGSLTNDYSLLSIKTATQNIDSNAKRIKEENQVQNTQQFTHTSHQSHLLLAHKTAPGGLFALRLPSRHQAFIHDLQRWVMPNSRLHHHEQHCSHIATPTTNKSFSVM